MRNFATLTSLKKYSVQFAAMDGRISTPFYFFQHLEHEASQTWQVVRSEFDTLMLDNAKEKGAEVMFETAAKRLLVDGDRCLGLEVEQHGETFHIEAPMTIDCGGRHGFAATQLGWIVPDPQLNKVAIWSYYKGGKRDEGYDEGATTVAYLPQKGWFWYIPLPNGIISLGVVADRKYLYRDGKNIEAILERENQRKQMDRGPPRWGRACREYSGNGRIFVSFEILRRATAWCWPGTPSRSSTRCFRRECF